MIAFSSGDPACLSGRRPTRRRSSHGLPVRRWRVCRSCPRSTAARSCRCFGDRLDRPRARASVVGQHGHVSGVDRVLAERRVATYMAAAYREHRFGRETYLEDVASMKSRYEQVRARGNVRALDVPVVDRPTADDRTLVYQKGGYVLHELRELVGDARSGRASAAIPASISGSR